MDNPCLLFCLFVENCGKWFETEYAYLPIYLLYLQNCLNR